MATIGPQNGVDLARDRLLEIRFNTESLDSVPVEFNAQPRRLRYLDMPTFDLEFLEQGV